MNLKYSFYILFILKTGICLGMGVPSESIIYEPSVLDLVDNEVWGYSKFPHLFELFNNQLSLSSSSQLNIPSASSSSQILAISNPNDSLSTSSSSTHVELKAPSSSTSISLSSSSSNSERYNFEKLADELKSSNKYIDAIPLYQKIIDSLDNSDLFFKDDHAYFKARLREKMGECWEALKEYAKAIPEYEKAIEKYKHELNFPYCPSATAHLGINYGISYLSEKLGNCWKELKEYKEAISEYEKAIEFALHNERKESLHKIILDLEKNNLSNTK